MDNKTKERNSSLEILRIISMVLIVMHHYSVHGAFNLEGQALTMNKAIIQIIGLGGKLGVNCFVLITGYFLVESKFKFKKLVILIGEVCFYSVIIFLIFVFFGLQKFSLEAIIASIFPVTFDGYWFITIYVILYILSPYINKLIFSLNRDSLFKLIFVGMFLFSFIPTFVIVAPVAIGVLSKPVFEVLPRFTIVSPGFSNLVWFILLYLIAAYCRLYPNKITLNHKTNLKIAFLSYGIAILSVILLDFIGTKVSLVKSYELIFMDGNRLPIAICSIGLFLVFKNLNIKTNKFINTVAKTTLGIYLIHDNQYVRPFLWKTLFKNNMYLNSKFLIVHIVLAVSLVFVVCSFIDFLRERLVQAPLIKLIDRKGDRFDRIGSYINGLIEKFQRKIEA